MGRDAQRPQRRRTSTRAYERDSGRYGQTARERGRRKRVTIVAVSVLCLLFVGASAASAAYYFHISDQLNRGDKSQEELDALNDVLETTGFEDPFYLVLIGSDARSDDPSMGARSDTNIVVRVDAPEGKVTLVSIPRDTRIQIPGHGTNKFNASYAFGGAAGVVKAAEELLDIDISHYAEVNFESLIDLVDAVGGVDVEVEEMIDDPKADLDASQRHNVIEEGMQHLDGQEALAFARSRAFAAGDFTRSAHQRQLIEAIIQQVLAAPITQMPTIIEKASQSVTTDLSISDILQLAQLFKDKSEITMYSAMLPSETAMIGGVSYVINNEAATEAMMELVKAGEDPATLDVSEYPMPAYDSDEGAGATGTSAGSAASDGEDGYPYDPDDDPYGSYSSNSDLYGYGGANTPSDDENAALDDATSAPSHPSSSASGSSSALSSESDRTLY